MVLDIVYVTRVTGRVPERGDDMALAEGILGWTSSESRIGPGMQQSP